jgi:putative transposase
MSQPAPAQSALVDSAQIAAVLGITERAVRMRAETAAWPYTTTAQRGGQKRWYAIDSLPSDVRTAFDLAAARALAKHRVALVEVTRQTITDIPDQVPMTPALLKRSVVAANTLVKAGQVRRVVTDLRNLSDRDRAVTDATLLLCAAVDEARAATGCSARVACTELATRVHSGQARPELVSAAQTTYLRPRQSPADPLCVGEPVALQKRLQRLYGFYSSGLAEGDPARYLVPARTPVAGEAMKHTDRVAFLAHSQQGLQRPSVDTFYRLERLLPVSVKNRGRFTGSAWRALMPYRARDVSMFKTNDIWVGDGHTFKARVQNPVHGKAFRPEVTFVLDWVSRKIVGYSVDLAESTIAVSAAFRDAQVRTRARPLVYYSDNGSGQTGKPIDCDVHGTLARQGIAHETGIPGNPQGRGVIERVWDSTLIRLASTYATFLGNAADAETVRKTQIAVEKDQRAGRQSVLVPSWSKFLTDLQTTVDDYNARPHGALAKACPSAVYDQRLDPPSSTPTAVSA